RAYLDKALENGATAILYEAFTPAADSGAGIGFSESLPKNNSRPPVWKTPSAGVTTVIVEDSRKAVAMAADAFY
uniref:hypothetical protein n=1 Tax=Klebsiella pneumoniae TaxID=573 RepID=UPI0025A2D403